VKTVLAALVLVAVVMAALLGSGRTLAETPTPLASATPIAASTPPPVTPSPTPTEPSFNFDIVKEVVVSLIGDDGRQHYVTLSQDTEGVMRVRLSLFYFPGGPYTIVLFRRGDCAATASFGPADVIASLPLQLEERSVGYLVLYFFNTRSMSLSTAEPNTIYDADGTSLAIYRPGSGGSGLKAACAVLAAAPGAPVVGNGTRPVAVGSSSRALSFAGAVLAAGGVALALWARRTQYPAARD
jgi:hypothetical protein